MHAPIAHTIKNACDLTGVSRSTLYKASQEGRIVFRKCGNRTLVLHEDLKRFIENLPAQAA